jgi:hypothetical protein
LCVYLINNNSFFVPFPLSLPILLIYLSLDYDFWEFFFTIYSRMFIFCFFLWLNIVRYMMVIILFLLRSGRDESFEFDMRQ